MHNVHRNGCNVLPKKEEDQRDGNRRLTMEVPGIKVAPRVIHF